MAGLALTSILCSPHRQKLNQLAKYITQRFSNRFMSNVLGNIAFFVIKNKQFLEIYSNFMVYD